MPLIEYYNNYYRNLLKNSLNIAYSTWKTTTQKYSIVTQMARMYLPLARKSSLTLIIRQNSKKIGYESLTAKWSRWRFCYMNSQLHSLRNLITMKCCYSTKNFNSVGLILLKRYLSCHKVICLRDVPPGAIGFCWMILPKS